MRRTLIAGIAAAAIAVVGAGSANAERPDRNFDSGSANKQNCQVVYQHDRGYIYVIEVTRNGETVQRTVRKLPYGGNYTIIETKDLGTRSVTKCEYK